MGEIRLLHPHQNGTDLDFKEFRPLEINGQMALGLKIAPKVFIIIHYVELGKPYMLLSSVRYRPCKRKKWHRGQKNEVKSEGYPVMG